eukprot:CAMPEP_0204516208 /NCGR_PEP_ID=MMETSP0661-20131031/3024_1 /ASSEMBLY_ACC=CAM_ASM_000606 /TAXON_ID=109239 /ORGANISM="Alexandrium margalefi, Strain AMGDE01CS-322" /LENGTH=77 /DNA_ID=CAMNT_0051521555 /DNA_START=153 /DNA_END=382 /DNA_ORIENTATION=-
MIAVLLVPSLRAAGGVGRRHFAFAQRDAVCGAMHRVGRLSARCAMRFHGQDPSFSRPWLFMEVALAPGMAAHGDEET